MGVPPSYHLIFGFSLDHPTIQLLGYPWKPPYIFIIYSVIIIFTIIPHTHRYIYIYIHTYSFPFYFHDIPQVELRCLSTGPSRVFKCRALIQRCDKASPAASVLWKSSSHNETIYIYVCIYVCSVHIMTITRMYIHNHTYIHVCMYVCMHACMHVCILS